MRNNLIITLNELMDNLENYLDFWDRIGNLNVPGRIPHLQFVSMPEADHAIAQLSFNLVRDEPLHYFSNRRLHGDCT